MSDSPPWHEVLGVAPDADADQVRAAFRRLAVQHHPDRGAESARRFREVSVAYQQWQAEHGPPAPPAGASADADPALLSNLVRAVDDAAQRENRRQRWQRALFSVVIVVMTLLFVAMRLHRALR